jgi:hypothetical protein
MMRIVVISIFGALLAACSGSNRFEDIVPAGATPRTATQSTSRKNHLESRGTLETEPRTTRAAEPQQANKPEVQNSLEE